jgi:lysophospholipase L1-like esterase
MAECKDGFSTPRRDRWLSAGWYSAAVAALAIAGWLSFSATASAQTSGERSINFVVDTSGSMSGTPLAEAKDALTAASTAIPQSAGVGLRSYAGSCGDGGVVRVPLGPYDPSAFSSAVQSLTAGGGTPTPDALRAGAADLPPDGERTLILISDGQSTCGDPCPVAEQIAADLGVSFRVHTVGFRAPDNAETELECIARVTGGTYVSASDRDALERAIGNAVADRELDYVALGDSYSSGEGAGAGNYFQDDKGKDIKCHRAPTAWSFVLAKASARIDDNVENAACRGAKTQAVTSERYKGEQPQVNRLRELANAQDVDLVTITIGGNDIGFDRIARNCFLVDCQNELKDNKKQPKLDTLKARLATSLYPALKQAAGQEARIVAVGYPRLLPTAQSDTTGCGWLEPNERVLLNKLVDDLNWTIRQAAFIADVDYVDVTNALNGNELCSADSHVVRIYGNRINTEQAHPDANGQRDYAAAVRSGLRALGIG